MYAIRKIIKTDRGKATIDIDIPEYFGEEVEVIILPAREKEMFFSYYMAKYQEETGFVKEVLGNEKEDVWNEV
ncbi:MAG: hypothetical protein DRG83_21410 [Deltaproteobacteria bacterium]|nr:MAG: hypothetical protein DRG83_21410 [Deltaproteobacteria bacterium]